MTGGGSRHFDREECCSASQRTHTTRARMDMHMCIYICVCIVYIYTYIQIYICIYVCIHVCVYVSLSVYDIICILDIYIYLHSNVDMPIFEVYGSYLGI